MSLRTAHGDGRLGIGLSTNLSIPSRQLTLEIVCIYISIYLYILYTPILGI